MQPPKASASGDVSMSMSKRHSLDWSHVGLPPREKQLQSGFVTSTLLFVAVVIGLIFGLVRYTEFPEEAMEGVERHYMYFIHVQIMVFIGFGFLMTFLRRYSYSAVSLNYFASALMFLEAILMVGATQQVFWNAKRDHIQIDIALLVDCSFCAASGMIAFGAIIGKSTPTQTLWLLLWQVPLYALNQQLVIHTFGALDMGGTIVIHLFGAYYGLAASYMLSRKQNFYGVDNPKNCSAYVNDIFSMIGTIFLWIYWPSFNGALASVAYDDVETATGAQKFSQFLSIVNTVLSLLGAVLSVFATSAFVGGRLNMVHVQNSTLAGGVAMGAACTLRMTPGGALSVGVFAGFLSTLGFQYGTPFLDRTLGLGDTCGVHNLHGMPAVLGTLVAGLAARGQHAEYLVHPDGATQLGYQVLAGVVTVGIALCGGLFGGWVVSSLNLGQHEPLAVPELFDDGAWWQNTTVEALPISASVHLASMANQSAHKDGTTQRGGRSSHGAMSSIREGVECGAGASTITVSGVPAGVGHFSMAVGAGGVVSGPTALAAPGATGAAEAPLFEHGVALDSAVRPVLPLGAANHV